MAWRSRRARAYCPPGGEQKQSQALREQTGGHADKSSPRPPSCVESVLPTPASGSLPVWPLFAWVRDEHEPTPAAARGALGLLGQRRAVAVALRAPLGAGGDPGGACWLDATALWHPVTGGLVARVIAFAQEQSRWERQRRSLPLVRGGSQIRGGCWLSLA